MKEYLESASDVLESLGTAADGLSSADAQSRLEKHGKNHNVAKTAGARELACFIWGMMNGFIAA